MDGVSTKGYSELEATTLSCVSSFEIDKALTSVGRGRRVGEGREGEGRGRREGKGRGGEGTERRGGEARGGDGGKGRVKAVRNVSSTHN